MYKAVLGITLLAVALLQVGEVAGESCTPNVKSNSLYVECGCTAEALEQVKQELRDEIVALKDEVIEALQESLKDDRTCRTQPGNSEACAATSCKEIIDKNPRASSGYYWVKAYEVVNVTEVFCDFNLTHCGTKGWMKVADLNMNDPTQQCPQELRLITSPKRLCGKSSSQSCNSVSYSTHGVPYQKVCGQAVGYRYNTPDAFHGPDVDVDQNYVDGISITYGHPRNHIWTYAAAWGIHQHSCPCNTNPAHQSPDFVGSDYYCETGYRAPGAPKYDGITYTNHPLWDGEDCQETDAPCCQRPGLPWFCKELSEPTTEDIEVRVCTNQDLSDEDIRVELIELYTQ